MADKDTVDLRVRITFAPGGVASANAGNRKAGNPPATPFQIAKRKIAELWLEHIIESIEVSELKD
jgi:hypothetical protein